jgi:glycosyltransferase involved in cell wall biosynthesis
LASTATSGLAGAVGIIKLHELVIELFTLAAGQIIAARTILRADHSANGRLFNVRFLSFHAVTLTDSGKVSNLKSISSSPSRREHVKLAGMKISVIVPAFNEEKLIAASLRSMQQAARSFAQRGWETEMIVCDNNSTDATAALARAEGARVVFEPVNQIARARNTGAAAAGGDWFVFVDADTRPTPELFADVVAQIESGRCLAGGCTMRYDERHFLADRGVGLWNVLSRLTKWAAGAFIFCEAQAFRSVGGFNVALFASEEIDLCKRLKKLARASGKKMVILRRHPLLTSARKMRLYPPGHIASFLKKLILRPSKTLASREACSYWYDGRR